MAFARSTHTWCCPSHPYHSPGPNPNPSPDLDSNQTVLLVASDRALPCGLAVVFPPCTMLEVITEMTDNSNRFSILNSQTSGRSSPHSRPDDVHSATQNHHEHAHHAHAHNPHADNSSGRASHASVGASRSSGVRRGSNATSVRRQGSILSRYTAKVSQSSPESSGRGAFKANNSPESSGRGALLLGSQPHTTVDGKRFQTVDVVPCFV